MGSNVSEFMKEAALLYFLSKFLGYGTMIASVSTLSKKLTDLEHVSMLFIEERYGLIMKRT